MIMSGIQSFFSRKGHDEFACRSCPQKVIQKNQPYHAVQQPRQWLRAPFNAWCVLNPSRSSVLQDKVVRPDVVLRPTSTVGTFWFITATRLGFPGYIFFHTRVLDKEGGSYISRAISTKKLASYPRFGYPPTLVPFCFSALCRTMVNPRPSPGTCSVRPCKKFQRFYLDNSVGMPTRCSSTQ